MGRRFTYSVLKYFIGFCRCLNSLKLYTDGLDIYRWTSGMNIVWFHGHKKMDILQYWKGTHSFVNYTVV